MKFHNMVDLSHAILAQNITKDDDVIDATMGNGNDTCFLAKIAKHVYAFDIQMVALEQTKKLLARHNLTNVTLFHESHEHIVGLVKDFKGVVFNLGYLPHGDHHITTNKTSTIHAISRILNVLKSDGFILLVIYPGHPEGFVESLAIMNYLETLDANHFTIIKVDMPFQHNHPPYLIFIKKR